MAGLFVILVIVLGLVIGSVIPAFIAKVLMSMMFMHRVSFGLILLATVLGSIFTVAAFVGLIWFAEGGLDAQMLENYEDAMTPAETGLAWLFGFMLQVMILTFVAPDQNMELVSGWKWALVLVLQYIVIAVIIFAVVFLIASFGVTQQTSQILTRVV